MGIFACVHVMLACFVTTQATQSGFYSCTEGAGVDMYTMTFSLNLNGDPITRIYAGDINGYESPTCASPGDITVDPSGVYDYVLTVDIAFLSPFDSLFIPPDCYGYPDGPEKVLTWYIYTAQYGPGGWRSSYDTKFTLTCDFNSATPLGIGGLLFEATLNSGDYNEDVLTQTVEDVTLAVFDETGTVDLGATSDTNPIVLGTPVRLVITLTRNNIGEKFKDRDYLGTVQSIKLNADYAAASFEGKVQLHLIEGETNGSTDAHDSRLFPDRDQQRFRIQCHDMTPEFLIYGTSAGDIKYFFIEDWQFVSEFKHSVGIVQLYPDPTGTRLLFMDDKCDGYVYNPVNDQIIDIPEFSHKIQGALWENWPLDKGAFIVFDDQKIYSYVYCRETVTGLTYSAYRAVRTRFLQRATLSSIAYYENENIVRPQTVSPLRTVPVHIKKPSYVLTGKEDVSDRIIDIKDDDQTDGLRRACKLAREVLNSACAQLRVGITTDEIDHHVHQLCIDRGAYPSPLLYSGFPKSICTSINNVACHGIPDDRPLCDGDIINIDITTFMIGNVDDEGKLLIDVAKQCRDKAIQKCGPREKFNEIGKTVRSVAESAGFNVVPVFCGHGIGEYFHGLPDVYHIEYEDFLLMEPGMAFTIEPVISEGTSQVKILDDGWTAVTLDDSRTAQFEHTIIITDTGVEILTE